jgi:hypothetical protein
MGYTNTITCMEADGNPYSCQDTYVLQREKAIDMSSIKKGKGEAGEEGEEGLGIHSVF